MNLPESEHPSPQVSVLMAVYNTEAYLAQSIESVLNQTWQDLELIIVDDCSTDGSLMISTEWARRDSRVVVIQNQTNSGASGALNQALKVARGQYITRQDSDDVSLPERLAEQMNFLVAHPEIGVVGTAVSLVNAQGDFIEDMTFPAQDAEIQTALPDLMCFCGPTVLTRRECLQTAGFYFDERLSGSEDYDFCLRLAEVTKMANLARPLYEYRQHGSSVSHIQRYPQMVRKAMALEAAMQRRYGAHPDAWFLALLGRDYLRAAVLAYLGGETGEAKKACQQALFFQPTLLDKPEPLAEILRRYTPRETVEQALAFSDGLFCEVLPQTRPLARLRTWWLAELHMGEVFAGIEQNQPQRVQSHLWPGIRHNPGWLLNRGVTVQAIKQLPRAFSR